MMHCVSNCQDVEGYHYCVQYSTWFFCLLIWCPGGYVGQWWTSDLKVKSPVLAHNTLVRGEGLSR